MHNSEDTLLFPDNGAWRMAATPLGRHFPILDLAHATSASSGRPPSFSDAPPRRHPCDIWPCRATTRKCMLFAACNDVRSAPQPSGGERRGR